MSSYPVLNDKPIDQWKVTELKEELKKRRLTTKGLKDDLIRRLDESLRKEIEIANASVDKGLASDSEPAGQYQDAPKMLVVDEKASVIINKIDNKDAEMSIDSVLPNVDVDKQSIIHEQVVGQDTDTTKQGMVAETTKETSVQETTLDTGIETTIVETSREVTTMEFSPVASESLATKLNMSGRELHNNGVQNKSEDLNIQLQNEDILPQHEAGKLDSSAPETQVYEVSKAKSDSFSTDNVSDNVKIDDLNIQPHENPNPLHEEANVNSVSCKTQVFEVSKVTSDSISTDNVSINEQIELKDNIIADDVKLEFDVKHNREEPSSGNVDLDDGILQPMDVKELQESETKVEETGNYADNPDLAKKNDSGDVELSEKLNLDRSSGDDSIEDDLLESKQIEPKSISDNVGDKREKMEVNVQRDEIAVDTMIEDTSTDGNIEKKDVPAVASVKRKSHDQATVGNSETTKRQRRWNSEGPKVLEPDTDNASPTITPKGTIQPNSKRIFSRSDSMASVETPKERVVPPSSKPPTSALRIDRFLRPFTLKAVQELLGKTGTVTNFWMDHIKTHCYVSYSSVEEAIETRNAVYNLQWPANGGRLLIAEFVEPHEVQMRLQVPPSPAAPVNTGPALPPPPVPMPSHPSPRVPVQRQAPQPPPTFPISLPPPPPPPTSSAPPVARERALPLPPPLPERVEPPIVTLDDLFRKTKATPRIYYLPLSDEQVKAKQDAEAKPPSSRD